MSEHSPELIRHYAIVAIVILVVFFGLMIFLVWKISLTAPPKKDTKAKHKSARSKSARPTQPLVPVEESHQPPAAAVAAPPPKPAPAPPENSKPSSDSSMSSPSSASKESADTASDDSGS